MIGRRDLTFNVRVDLKMKAKHMAFLFGRW